MARTAEELDWVEATRAAVEQLAAAHGWELDDGRGYSRWAPSSMGSWYTTLQRTRQDADGDDEYQTVKVRVSDHATAYCREDVSLAFRASGDDHTLEQLAAVLASPFVAD